MGKPHLMIFVRRLLELLAAENSLPTPTDSIVLEVARVVGKLALSPSSTESVTTLPMDDFVRATLYGHDDGVRLFRQTELRAAICATMGYAGESHLDDIMCRHHAVLIQVFETPKA